jgi:hypothetical protein
VVSLFGIPLRKRVRLSMALGISEAQLLGVFLASVFWGMFLITFVQCMRYLLWDSKGYLKSASTINWVILTVALLLASISTFDVALGLMHSIEAFILYTGPGGSTARFTELTDWVNILKTCTNAFGNLINDGVLIYRCWVIYNKKWLVISLSLVIWLGDLALTIFLIFLEASASNPRRLLTGSESALTPTITSWWTLSLFNNLFSTGLIVYRLWRVDKNNSLYAVPESVPSSQGFFNGRYSKRTRLQRVIRIIVESGLLSATASLITFVTYLSNSNAFYPTSDAELQILSIAFNLIIIRIHSHPNEDYSMHSGRSHNLPTFPLRNFTSEIQSGGTREEEGSSKRPIEVSMRSEVDVNYPSTIGESYKTGIESTQDLDSETRHQGSAV